MRTLADARHDNEPALPSARTLSVRADDTREVSTPGTSPVARGTTFGSLHCSYRGREGRHAGDLWNPQVKAL